VMLFKCTLINMSCPKQGFNLNEKMSSNFLEFSYVK
jgi:hypothetical protein